MAGSQSRFLMARKVTVATVHQFADDLFDAVLSQEFSEGQTRKFCLPGLDVQVRSRDPQYLRHCTQAFGSGPVRQDSAQKSMCVSVVDRNTMPDLPGFFWDEPEFSIKRMVDALQQHGYQGMYEFDYRLWQFHRDHDGESVQLMLDNTAYPPWESAFPARQFVYWAYRGTDRRLIHAGTLGYKGLGVLLAGSGGSGKSGTTLSGVLHGLSTVGDDYIVVQKGTDGLRMEPVIKLMKQDESGLNRLGLSASDAPMKGPNWQNKFVFYYTELKPDAATDGLDLKAILLPVITGSDRTEIAPANTREAVMALVPSSLYQLKGGWTDTLTFTSGLCRRVPAFHLRLGRNSGEIAGAIRKFIEGRTS